MSVTSYTVIDGEIVSENRNGFQSDYIPDSLGSTVALVNASHQITDTFTYWPFGELRSHIGTSITAYTYCGTLGYRSDSIGYYVRARELKASQARWLTVDPIWPAMFAYAYAQANIVTLTDRSGLAVYRCTRPLRCRDFQPSCPESKNYCSGTHHWWLYMDRQSGECQSIGYGPNGSNPPHLWHHIGNLGYGRPGDIHCYKLSDSPTVEKCVCDLAKKAEQGYVLCGSTWRDGGTCRSYNFVTHNCQDFTICLMHLCGVGHGWEFEQEGFPPYWPPIVGEK